MLLSSATRGIGFADATGMVQLDTTPYWVRTSSLPSFPPLDSDRSVDVAVVGGGLVGITTAYLLKVAGLKVALLERAECAAIDTGHTTAHVTMVTDQLLSDLVTHFGRDTGRRWFVERRFAAAGRACGRARLRRHVSSGS